MHNVVVWTLCSCYPKLLLGIPPAWYKSLAYLSRVVVDPRGVLAEFGLVLPEIVTRDCMIGTAVPVVQRTRVATV